MPANTTKPLLVGHEFAKAYYHALSEDSDKFIKYVSHPSDCRCKLASHGYLPRHY